MIAAFDAVPVAPMILARLVLAFMILAVSLGAYAQSASDFAKLAKSAGRRKSRGSASSI